MTKASRDYSRASQLSDPVVAAARLAPESYAATGKAERERREALGKVAAALGWADSRRGPLGNVIAPGARVLVKPNFVMHRNAGPWGIDPLVTHPSLISCVVEAALAAGASEVTVGDAPVQGCDFDQLLKETGLDEWAAGLCAREPRFRGIRDFRRTTCVFVNGVRVAAENLVSEDEFVLFDLGSRSLLEPITDERGSFRVTCYDPRLMQKTHASGRHQYLVARDVLEADVIINMPKLKTHKKAGVTCALKNLIGINGNKEYLPHHRVGGSTSGGDCYPGASIVKRAHEYTLDRQNQASSFAMGRLWSTAAMGLDRVSRLLGDRLGIEGSWSGNDTVWRTCLDLNRILLYGLPDATFSDALQRQVIHIVDSVIAGQGDGPLAPQPLALGLVVAGRNAAAVDWVGARLLGYDPERINLARESFGRFSQPLTSFDSSDVLLVGDLGEGRADSLLKKSDMIPKVVYPAGWLDAAHNADRL